MATNIVAKVLDTRPKQMIAFGQLCFAFAGLGALDSIHTVHAFQSDPKFPEYVQKHNGDEREALFHRFEYKYGKNREQADACAMACGTVMGAILTITGTFGVVGDWRAARRKEKECSKDTNSREK